MKLSLSLGRFFGIKVFLHWSFLLFLVWIGFSNYEKGGMGVFWAITFILGVFACITLHEFGHALVARRYGIKTRDVTLYPIGGVASLEKMPEKPQQELAVALAGPAVNVAIALLIYPFVDAMEAFDSLSTITEFNQDTLIPALFSVNVFLPLFNMIPAFPLDGGRVLRALLSMKLNRTLATRIAATIGQVFAVFMVIQGFGGNFFLIVIGGFVFIAAENEARIVKQQELLRGVKIEDVMMCRYPTLNQNETIGHTVDSLLNTPYKRFLVVEGEKVVGLLTEGSVIKGYAEKGGKALVSEIMYTDILMLNPDMLLEEVIPLLQEYIGFLPVQKDEKLVGVLDLENIQKYLIIRQIRLKKPLPINLKDSYGTSGIREVPV